MKNRRDFKKFFIARAVTSKLTVCIVNCEFLISFRMWREAAKWFQKWEINSSKRNQTARSSKCQIHCKMDRHSKAVYLEWQNHSDYIASRSTSSHCQWHKSVTLFIIKSGRQLSNSKKLVIENISYRNDPVQVFP